MHLILPASVLAWGVIGIVSRLVRASLLDEFSMEYVRVARAIALYEEFAQALQNRVDMLWTDFVNRGDPVQQRAIEQERNKALAELEALKKEIDDNVRAIAQIEDDARRAGVPIGWLRQ